MNVESVQDWCWKLKRCSIFWLSPLCGGHDGVYHLDDSVQGRVGADRHVGSTEVVVDGAHHPHDVQGRVLLHGVGFDQT